jgi:stage IV sporulation protein FB
VFFEPEQTQYDLKWRMFGVPVRVHPWFWLMSLMLGWDLSRLGLQYVLLWVACVFLSILVHELGHVFMGRIFGAHSHIVLHAFGGLAIGSSALHNRWKRIAVYLAGPGAGFILYGLVWLAMQFVDPHQSPRWVLFALIFLKWINLGWGLLNLLPIWPLDGGQVSRDFLDWLMPDKGVRVALAISIVTAGLIALNCLSVWRLEHSLPLLDQIPFLENLGGLYNALLFAALAFNSYQALQVESNRQPWDREWDR